MAAELPKTSWLLLGMIEAGDVSGYDIKAQATRQARFFWATSEGQIYPELRRLTAAGLVRGREDPHGGRRRTAYSLTADGRAALDEWRTSIDPPGYELRDEGLLRIYFADELSVAQLRVQLELLAERHERTAHALERIDAELLPPARALTLRYGRDLHAWKASWFASRLEDLAGLDDAARVGDVLGTSIPAGAR